MLFKDQVAIVTGGGLGIGREISIRMAAEGAHVVIADIAKDKSRETLEIIEGEAANPAVYVQTDITSEDSVKKTIATAKEITGKIDIIVNNAGVMGPVKKVEDIELKEWNDTMAVNLAGMFLCCKHVTPIMKAQSKGSIVNIASITGKRPLTERLPYAASKMGVIGLTRTLAAELGPWKIRVNAICPGAVTGDRQRLVYEGIAKFSGKPYEQVLEEASQRAPLRSLVHPKNVARLAAFLCSDEAEMMTGQDINVSAGAVMY